MNALTIGTLHSSPVIRRHPANPLLTPKNVPYGPAMVFNAGVTKYQGKYVMVFRNDYGDAGKQTILPHSTTNLGLATSDDGVRWDVKPAPCWTWNDEEVIRVYDPRLTVIDGKCYMCFAVDTRHGLRGGIAVTEDFDRFEVLSLSVPDNRNMVLFPEKVAGRYVRLERPFPVYSRGGIDRFDMWMSDSPDLQYWGNSKLVLSVKQVPFANDKVGPGAPPVKTEKGWLTTFHAVDLDHSRGKNGGGGYLEKALYRWHYAAGSGEPEPNRRHVEVSAACAGSALRNGWRFPQRCYIPRWHDSGADRRSENLLRCGGYRGMYGYCPCERFTKLVSGKQIANFEGGWL